MIIHPQLGEIQAVLFDVDGTLYRRNLVRKKIILKFFSVFLHNPVIILYNIFVLYKFRKIRETLRKTFNRFECLETQQFELTARSLGISQDSVRAIVKKKFLLSLYLICTNLNTKLLMNLSRSAKKKGF